MDAVLKHRERLERIAIHARLTNDGAGVGPGTEWTDDAPHDVYPRPHDFFTNGICKITGIETWPSRLVSVRVITRASLANSDAERIS